MLYLILTLIASKIHLDIHLVEITGHLLVYPSLESLYNF